MGVEESKGKERSIRVIVGEDSPFMRRLIVETLERDPEIEVVATGANGRDVLKKTVECKPDVVTLDLEMPKMDGLETLRYIMSEWPTPVVIISAHTEDGGRITMKCLEYGAVDFIPKSTKLSSFPAEELVEKVKLAATVDASKVRFEPFEQLIVPGAQRSSNIETPRNVVLIGASTGGPQALMEVIPKLPPYLPACVIVVQHMPPNFTRYLAERLNVRSTWIVKEAQEGDKLIPGKVLVAPGGMHFFVKQALGHPAVMLLERNDLSKSVCPSLDFAMTSLAPVFNERLLCVVLTGMGRDGSAGAVAVRRAGGKIICQDSETSMIYGMPGAIAAAGLADAQLPIHDIADAIETEIADITRKVMAHESQ